MDHSTQNYITPIWIILAVITLASWLMGEGAYFVEMGYGTHLAVGLLALAFFKVRLVIMYFMEVKHAPLILRALFEAWVLLVFFAMCFIFLSSGALS